jgi:hypothetical protein
LEVRNGMEEGEEEIFKCLGGRGWYFIFLITPDKYPKIVSLSLEYGKSNSEEIHSLRPVLKFLPFLRAGYSLGLVIGCHRAVCLKALGWWEVRFSRHRRNVIHVFIPPAEWSDGSRRHNWIWKILPDGRAKFYCPDCRERRKE